MKKTSVKKKRRVKTKTAAAIGNGWISTDEEEIERRRLRSIEEPLTVKSLKTKSQATSIYGDYLVTSTDDKQYLVEYRHKQLRINSCTCPDYQVNGLATCKHVERVSRFLLRKKAPPRRTCTEIFLNRAKEHTVEVLWADGLRANSKVKKLLTPYFSADNIFVQDSADAFKNLEKSIYQAGLSPIKVKISTAVIPWLEQQANKVQADRSRAAYLQDVEQGKRVRQVVKYPLYDYQYDGMLHLAFKGRVILADEMGLGKTVQAVAACELLRQLKHIERVMVISPVSLKTEWEEQISKFTDLSSLVIQGNRAERLKLYQKPSFFYLSNYEQLLSDANDIQSLLIPDVIILDEAQRVKNWQTKTAQMVKRLQSPYLFVLTGTPLENRIDEIYSIAQVVDPHLLGPLFRFNREFYQLDEKGKPTGYKNLDKLHYRLRPILLRRRKEDVEDELPERINNTYFVSMHKEQFLRYDEHKTKVARLLHKARQRPLSPDEYKQIQMNLACMRMLCDTPYILDQQCRISPKLDELKKILPEQLETPDNKIIIFSEWTKMLDLIREYLDSHSIEYAWHTGQVPQKKRRAEINRFKNEPQCRLFLSSDAGATGLNLQVANIVINMDLPWNPAKLEQRIARAWRKHQHRQVNVINLVCESSIEHRIMSILEQKSMLAKGVIDGGGEPDMDLPSGRKVMIERLEQMMGRQHAFIPAGDETLAAKKDQATMVESIEDSGTDKTGQDPLKTFINDIKANHPETLTHLSVFEDSQGKKSVFSVVDVRGEEPMRQLQEITGDREEVIDSINVIDSETMATIQRLVEAGVLSFNTAQQTVIGAKNPQPDFSKRKQSWIKSAMKRFDQVEHKFKMAELLMTGGFEQEAVKPGHEALELAISCLYEVTCGKQKEKVDLAIIEKQLVLPFDLPKELLTILASLREGYDDYRQEAMHLIRHLLDKADEELLACALQ